MKNKTKKTAISLKKETLKNIQTTGGFKLTDTVTVATIATIGPIIILSVRKQCTYDTENCTLG